jgi:hypothetical protein
LMAVLDVLEPVEKGVNLAMHQDKRRDSDL